MAKAIEAGRAVLKLVLDDKELNKKFAQTQRSLRNVGRNVRSAGLQIGGLGAAITAPFALATAQFIKTGDELNKMSARTGVSVQALSELKFAAQQSGASLGDVEKGIKGMQRVLLDAEQGLSTATDTLELLGLSLDELKGKAPEDQFELIARNVAAIEDPSKRAAVSMEVFGRAGQVLQPMLADMEALRAEAQELGITMDEETAQSAADLADAFNRAKQTVVALAVQVGAALAPSLIDLANIVIDSVKFTLDFVKSHQRLIVVTAATGAALVALGSTLVTVGGIIAAVSVGVGGLSKAIAFLRLALTLLAGHPIVAALLTIGGVVAWLTDGFGLFSEAVEDAGESLDKVAKVKPQAPGSFGDQGDKLAQQAAQTQARLAQQLTALPSASQPTVAVPSETDKRSLRSLEELVRIGRDQLTAFESKTFIAGYS